MNVWVARDKGSNDIEVWYKKPRKNEEGDYVSATNHVPILKECLFFEPIPKFKEHFGFTLQEGACRRRFLSFRNTEKKDPGKKGLTICWMYVE